MMRATGWGLAAAVLIAGGGQARAGVVIETEPNDSLVTAQNVDGSFTLSGDPDITDSSTVPNVSIRGAGDDTHDWYSFTVAAGKLGIFDIDYGMDDFDPWLSLYDSGGGELVSQDDGGLVDTGSVHPFDPYFSYTFTTAGTYYLQVGRFPGNDVVPSGADYRLQVTIQDASVVPEPGSLALLSLGGVGLIGGTIRRRRKQQSV